MDYAKSKSNQNETLIALLSNPHSRAPKNDRIKATVADAVVESRTTDLASVIAKISLIPTSKEYLLFFSYAQKDTALETSLFFNEAQTRFPNHKIFLDKETKFKLDELIQHVRSAKNVVILLSGNYAKRPYTLVELHHALKSEANICPVTVSRSGMESFNFERIRADIKSGGIKDYLSQDGWDLLYQQNITVGDVIDDLNEVMNVTASQFSGELPSKVQKAMIESIFDGLSMQ